MIVDEDWKKSRVWIEGKKCDLRWKMVELGFMFRGKKLKLMEHEMVSGINRRTTTFKLWNERLLMFYVQNGHGKTIW